MYHLIEDYASDGVVHVAGRTYPSPSLIEDPDGIRILLLPGSMSSIPASLWGRAHASGAAALLCVEDEGIYSFLLAESFIASRTEDTRGQAYVVPKWNGMVSREAPTYTMMVSEPGDEPTEDDGIFVHVHTHFEYSALDGLSTVPEAVAAAVADGQKYLASADHGNCAVHPELQEECDKAGIKPIFGQEAYFVPDRHRRMKTWFEDVNGSVVSEEAIALMTDKERKSIVRKTDGQEALNEYTHITLWAMDDEGLRNLWAMSTVGYIEGFYGKPRIDWETLVKFNKGVMASTGCLRGPVPQLLLKGDVEGARQTLARMLDIFGDRLYVEIHANHLEEQIRVNHQLVQLANEMRVPMVAAVDSHYAREEDAQTHRAWLAVQTDKDVTDDSSLFAGGQKYHLATAAEVYANLAYLGEEVALQSMAETVKLARRCTARVGGATSTPTYSNPSTEHPDPIKRDVERLIELCLGNWDRKVRGKAKSEAVYAARFEREIQLLIAKGFCGYFLIVWDYCKWAKEQGILVGPGRGSGGGSLVAYLADIVEIDPVDADLLFERFLTEGRTSLPDFDIDFPASKRATMKSYVRERWGDEYVVSIGTVTRLRNKQAIKDAARVLKPTLPYEVNYSDLERIGKLIEEADRPLAGKHMPWDEFCAQFAEDVDPIRAKYPEVFELVDKWVNRVKTYGKHAAGVVISTNKDVKLTHLPLRVDKDGNVVTQFDMVALELLGFVKFDLLTLRTLDTIQLTLDLVQERHGRKINIYDWKDEYFDPQVWDAVAEGQTLGIFQIETRSGTRLTRQFQPHSLHDLAAVMTLVRPGPKRSGLTDTYLRRRAGQEEVSYPEPRLEEALGDTYGTIIYQENVMAVTMILAGYDGTEADAVRSILGKKKIEKVAAAGEEFVRRAIENGTNPAVATLLWEQMAEFAKYSFNKAHAFGYAVLGYWTAWLKFHYPVLFLTAALATVDDERIPEFISEARRVGYLILPPDINESDVAFRATDLAIRYGLSSIKGMGEDTAKQIVEHQPYESFDGFMAREVEPKGSKVNKGHVATLAAVGSFDSLVENRRALELQLEAEASGAAKACVFKDPNFMGPGGLPCRFDWANEPNPPMVMTGRGKNKVSTPKPPPKKCTTACRNYTKPKGIDPASVPPYGDADIRDREKEYLGVWLSSTPFDRLDMATRDMVMTAEEIENAPLSGGDGYFSAAIVTGVREKLDRNGNKYAFVTLMTEVGEMDTICFSRTYATYRADIKQDRLLLVKIVKTDRGLNLDALAPA